MENVKQKKSIFKKWWFWLIIGVVIVIIIGSSSGSEPSAGETGDTDTSTSTETEQTDVPVTYVATDLQTMLDELNANAMKAEKTYQDKNVEVVGNITNFDSDGSYISIEPVNADEWNFDTVQCYIENENQLNFLLEKQVGDTVTIRGKITSIGEVLGYSIEIAEVF